MARVTQCDRCKIRGSTIWTNCLEWGRCTMRDARKLPEITEEEE